MELLSQALRIPAALWLIVSALLLAAGDFTSKLWADSPRSSLVVGTIVLYICSSLCWFPALYQKNSLAIMGTAWSVLTAVAVVFIGVVVFGETLSIWNWIGVGCALVALYFLSA